MTLLNASSNSPPLVSVVIPAYNAGRTLAQTLDSVLAQSYSNIEIIVVDDGSTDATAEVLQAYEKRIRSIYQPNKGLPSARNTGCMAARGEFIALMDADDLCRTERLAVQIEAMLRAPEAVLCSTDFAAFNECGLVASSYSASYYSMIQNAAGGLRSFYSFMEISFTRLPYCSVAVCLAYLECLTSRYATRVTGSGWCGSPVPGRSST